jgi:hypothetical protein
VEVGEERRQVGGHQGEEGRWVGQEGVPKEEVNNYDSTLIFFACEMSKDKLQIDRIASVI